MTSLLTNVAALAALQTLRNIDSSLENTQNRISSGLRVKDADDNAAYWSIATTMKSDQTAMATVNDALGLAAAKTDTTNAGLTQTLDIIKKIKNKLVATSEPGVSKTKVGSEIEQLKEQLKSVAQSSSFSGENWLYNTTEDDMPVKKMVGAMTRSGNEIGIQTIDFDASKSVMIDTADARRGLLTNALDIDDPASPGTPIGWFLIDVDSTIPANGDGGGTNDNQATATTLNEIKVTDASTDAELAMMLSAVDQIFNTLTQITADLGAVKARVDSQNSFVKDLVAVIEKGVGQLVDADMNEESTRLKALQTQQQLGIQSLSIANTNAQNIMQLFRNG